MSLVLFGGVVVLDAVQAGGHTVLEAEQLGQGGGDLRRIKSAANFEAVGEKEKK